MLKNNKRVLIKLSGEVFASNNKSRIFDEKKILNYSHQIAEVCDHNIETIIVVGGGNIYRGRENYLSFLSNKMADWVGINATILNGIVLKSALENKFKKKVKIISFYNYQTLIEKFSANKVNNYLKKGYIIISVAMGVPGVSTDTIAANVAKNLKCAMILKGTKVDGVYSADPIKVKSAIKYDQLSYNEAIDKKLKVMDLEAFKICQKNKIKIRVFNINKEGNLIKAAKGEEVGTIIK